ncbi:MAG: NAD(P)/FAD-dependent oxidoreductase [Deinococcales bacterium]
MAQRSAKDAIVVGAGLGGLAAARTLQNAGFSVLVVEKSRGVSGRAATRRLENGAVVDHGAPFFTVRNESFRQFIQPLEREGIVQVWQYGSHHWKNASIERSSDGYPRYVAPDGINTLGKALRDSAPTLNIKQEALVSAIWSNHLGYRVVLENGDIHTARAVLVNAPAPQALTLTHNVLENQTHNVLEQVKFAPCWALIVGLDTAPSLPWQFLKMQHPVFSMASLEHSKHRSMPALVLHANAEWSSAHLEQNSKQVSELMLQAAQELFGAWLHQPHQIICHRWRYAQAINPYPEAYLAQDGLVFCGDWCAPNGNARIETAFESGLAAAKYLSGYLEQPLSMILSDEALVNFN